WYGELASACPDCRPCADVALRRPAQRHGATRLQAAVCELRLACARTQHLCAAGDFDASATVLAVAANHDGRLANQDACACLWRDCRRLSRLAYRALQYFPDQPFRAVRLDAGGHPFHGSARRADQVQDARPLSGDPGPYLPRLYHRMLAGADHDAGPSVIRGSDDDLGLCRYLARRARSGHVVRRGIPPLQAKGRHVAARRVLNIRGAILAHSLNVPSHESRPSRQPRGWRGLRWKSWTTPSEGQNMDTTILARVPSP